MNKKILHQELYDQITSSLKRGENVQLCGLKGLGKSRLLRDIEENQIEDLVIYRTDLGLLSDNSTDSVLKLIFGSILGLEKIRGLEKGELPNVIRNYFSVVAEKNQKAILLLDSFDKLRPGLENSQVFNFLSTLHSQFQGRVGFVFGVEKPLTNENSGDTYGDFGRLLFSKTVYITPLDKEQSFQFIDTQESECHGLKLTSEQKNKINESSGGYMFVIKRLIQGISSGTRLEDMILNPSIYPALAYNCELVFKQIESGENSYEKYYIKDKNGNFICKVFENYLNSRLKNIKVDIEDRLTASEHKVFKFLSKRKGQICSREDIITAIWGDFSDTSISDHALDQIMSRLRNKLNNFSNQRVQTVRGRGHKLI